MQAKSETHEALSLLLKIDGVSNNLILDGSKEQTLANFRKKCRQCDCHAKQIEPYPPWCNSCEVAIKMVKLASGRDLRRIKCPKVVWDDCIERQCYIRSFTAHNIYTLHGETPEKLINNEMLVRDIIDLDTIDVSNLNRQFLVIFICTFIID